MKQRKETYKKELEDQIKLNKQIKDEELKKSKINTDDYYYTQWET
jgi:hypothetical protein